MTNNWSTLDALSVLTSINKDIIGSTENADAFLFEDPHWASYTTCQKQCYIHMLVSLKKLICLSKQA